MKDKKLFLVLLMAVGVVMAGVSATMAWHSGPGDFGFPGLKLKAFLADLDLSDTQQQAIKSIRGAYRDQQHAAGAELRAAVQELIAVAMNKQFNEAAVREAFKAVSAAEEEMVVLRAKMAADVRAVLTEEQLAQMRDRLKRARERLEARRAMLDTVLDNLGQ